MTEDVKVVDIDLTDVQKEAQDASKTLKDLRNEVKQLRQTLENTEISSEEFGKTLSDLTKKQQELTNVTKSGISAQKGSYNELVNQMAILKTEWRSTADESRRAALGEQISSINTQLKELDSSIGNHQREVGNYKLALKNLKEELLNLEEGTEEYNRKLSEAAEIAQKMQDVNEFVAASAADLGDHMQNLVGTASGMVGAFQTVQATLNLVGVESKEVTQMISTMQNVMAITQGLSAIEGSIDAFKRLRVAVAAVASASKVLRVALVGLGIGAVVAAAAALYEWYNKLSDQTEDLAEKTKKLREEHAQYLDLIESNADKALTKLYNNTTERLKAAGNNVSEIKKILEGLESEKDYIENKRLVSRVVELKQQLSELKEGSEEYIEVLSALREAEKELAKYLAQNEINQANNIIETAKKNAEIEEARKEAARKSAEDAKKEAEEARKEAEEARKEAEEARKEALTELESLRKELDIEREFDPFEKEKISLGYELEEASKIWADYRRDELISEEEHEEAKLIIREKYLIKLEEVLNQQSEEEKRKKEEELEYERRLRAGLIRETRESLNILTELNPEGFGKEFTMTFDTIQTGLMQMEIMMKNGKKGWKEYGQMAASGLNAAANILSSIASKQDTETKEGFEKQKKMQIASATMAMLGGVVSAVSSAFNPANAWMTIWGQAAAAAAMSAMVLATGGMQIAQIKKQKFDGDGGNSDSIGVPALSALQMIDTGVQATTNIDGASVEGNVNDTRVYVVESDITTSQSSVKTTISEATF